MTDYFAKTAPERFPHVPRELWETFRPTEFPDWVVEVCGLHFFVAEGSSYERTGSSIPDPGDMLYRLEGDCQDQSVLLASLYMSVDLDVRFVRVSKPGQSHVLTEVYCPAPDSDLVCSVLRKFYSRELGRDVGEIAFEERSGESGFWLVADPEWSSFVGDISTLRGDYITDSASGWEWRDLRQVQKM